MSVDLETLGIHRLSVGDRLDLIEQIWESLPEQLDPKDVPDGHLTELAIRRARAEAEPRAGKPWHEVVKRLGERA